MKNIVIVYGSTTGNTERVAGLIKDELGEAQVINVADVDNEVVKAADLVLFGTSTWGYGDLQDDFADYIDAIDADLVGGKDVAVFGCGDSASFPDVFCQGVTEIMDRVQQAGGKLIVEELRVDGDVDDNLDAITAFANSVK